MSSNLKLYWKFKLETRLMHSVRERQGKFLLLFLIYLKIFSTTTFAQLKAFLISMKCIRGKDTRMNI